MGRLTAEQIELLASREDARRVAVENFLSTVDPLDGPGAAFVNMRADARSYKWNESTVDAIRTGLVLIFGTN
jgi:hypothetical protein